MPKRKMTAKIESWMRTKTRQGLLVTGARQVGKTSIIEHFASLHYENVIKIDFIEQPAAAEVIGQAENLDDLIVRITALASSPLAQGKTLLFFDEVQRCGDAVSWMRYLATDDRFDVIYSGSLLGADAFDYRSLPAGTLDVVEMFPMDFEEFSWAYGIDPTLWDIVRERFAASAAIPDFIHDRMMQAYHRYVLVGGMSEAVQVFVAQRDTQAMRARQRGILDAYRADITRYVADPVHAQRIKTIFNAIPAQLNKENRRFIVSGIDKRRRFEDMQSDFDWLVNAGVAIPVKRVSEAAFPLGMSRDDSYFKFYMSDCGLLFSTFSAADVEAIVAMRDAVNFGQAFENAVAQELRAAGRRGLYYFNKAKVGEVDFLVDVEGAPEVLPIEVKSGKNSHAHAALDHLMDVENFHLKRAVVLHIGNVEAVGKVTYLPIYTAGLL